ncbi:hypothetical protein QQF64_008237 [Cirrhinus molitorella]|uniref:Tyr recombinase domain-containing protein n=1 Tax=Cirrhinus molitorella TaxID=172907 RepID=A0ABR3M6Z9_9TELE
MTQDDVAAHDVSKSLVDFDISDDSDEDTVPPSPVSLRRSTHILTRESPWVQWPSEKIVATLLDYGIPVSSDLTHDDPKSPGPPCQLHLLHQARIQPLLHRVHLDIYSLDVFRLLLSLSFSPRSICLCYTLHIFCHVGYCSISSSNSQNAATSRPTAAFNLSTALTAQVFGRPFIPPAAASVSPKMRSNIISAPTVTPLLSVLKFMLAVPRPLSMVLILQTLRSIFCKDPHPKSVCPRRYRPATRGKARIPTSLPSGQQGFDAVPYPATNSLELNRPIDFNNLLNSAKSYIAKEFRIHLSTTLTAAGFSPELYSSHSFRIVAATTAAERGVPESTIKLLGRWSSSAYETYIRSDYHKVLDAQQSLAT